MVVEAIGVVLWCWGLRLCGCGDGGGGHEGGVVVLGIEATGTRWCNDGGIGRGGLVVPAVVEFVNSFKGGIEGIKKRNHESVVETSEMLVSARGTHLGNLSEMSASMVMAGLPPSLGIVTNFDALKLRTHFRDHFGVEVQFFNK
ncbi:hypothetical protein RJT34_21583 [Clitoria ternatea]|uniref:Uncharacterized protein n=1 Tax=Clitoria ternatea TaxID=43366 RepID=A0AAN9IV59_CLITE